MTLQAKVLIVDDKEANLLALEQILYSLDMEIKKALSGAEALRLTLQHKFALIISDVRMPEMDGYEMAGILHNSKETKLIPIIFVSAIDKSDVYMIKGIEKGAVDFIFKPIVPEILLGKVTIFLDLYYYQQSLIEAKEIAKTMSEKAMSALDAKSMFLSTMSHEIRTPMNAIIGFTELLLDGESDTDKIEYLEIIKSSGDGLLCIIDDILDLSKFELGKVEIEKLEIDLRDFLNLIIKIYHQEAIKRNIKLILDFDESLLKFYIGDSHRLRQILINLLGNALKFTHNGKVTLKVTEVVKDYLCFQVIDTGIGIKKTNLSKIFESFSQAEMSTTRKYGGTGLGLSIVKEIVDLWGGEVKLESKVNRGSTFSVTLPMVGSDLISESQSIITSEPYEELSGLKILCCEDNVTNIRLIEAMLASLQLEVTIAKTGERGVDLFKEFNFDIILMDISMPGISGIEAVQLIRKTEDKESLKRIPILAVTANVLPEDIELYFSSGFDSYITKPYKREELYRQIKKFGLQNRIS